MVQLSNLSTNILNTAGDLSKSNAATTMVTTGLGFVRAGMVPFDKKSSPYEKSQVVTWMVTATILSLLTQASVYKLLENVLNSINIKNLSLKPFEKEYISLSKLPLDHIDEALKISQNSNSWVTVKKSILKAFNLKNPEERKVVKSLFSSLNGIAKKTVGSTKAVDNNTTQMILENVKNMKGSKQFFMYLFGAALFTGYVIPGVICKYLPNMIKFGHDHIKINGKSIFPEPKEPKEEKKKKSNFKMFGIPILGSAAVLGFLKCHTFDLSKGVGKKIQDTLKKIGKWDYNMAPNARIVRNIFTNAILRPFAAILDGKIFVAAYNFVVELLSAGSLLTTKRVLGSANKKDGLIGATIKKLNITNPKQIKGLEFLMTHGIQTFLILGIVLGLTTNVLSRHLSNFIKNTLKITDDKETKDINNNVFIPSLSLKDMQGKYNQLNQPILTKPFEEFLKKTGNLVDNSTK